MAKAKAKAHRKRAGFTLPVAVVAGFAPLALGTFSEAKRNGIEAAGHHLVSRTTGYDYIAGDWNASRLMQGLGPVVLGVLVHKMIGGKLGVNRALSSAGVPFLRV